MKRATTDAAGNFHVKDVAPGNYRVYAWEVDLDQSSRSAEFRKLFDAKSAAVSIGSATQQAGSSGGGGGGCGHGISAALLLISDEGKLITSYNWPEN